MWYWNDDDDLIDINAQYKPICILIAINKIFKNSKTKNRIYGQCLTNVWPLAEMLYENHSPHKCKI